MMCVHVCICTVHVYGIQVRPYVLLCTVCVCVCVCVCACVCVCVCVVSCWSSRNRGLITHITIPHVTVPHTCTHVCVYLPPLCASATLLLMHTRTCVVCEVCCVCWPQFLLSYITTYSFNDQAELSIS